jgi:hypothetical protein
MPVDVVNGDNPAMGPRDSRVKRIQRFEASPGFGAMSPLAVGVGLTVVGANRAIHLERHWNPAKEAQATDRVYRIGQTRDVHVYFPMALHRDVDSLTSTWTGCSAARSPCRGPSSCRKSSRRTRSPGPWASPESRAAAPLTHRRPAIPYRIQPSLTDVPGG